MSDQRIESTLSRATSTTCPNNRSVKYLQVLTPEQVRAAWEQHEPSLTAEGFARHLGITRRALFNYLQHGIWVEVTTAEQRVIDFAGSREAPST